MSVARRSTSSANCAGWPRPNRICDPTCTSSTGSRRRTPGWLICSHTIVAPFDGPSRARRIAGEMTWFRRKAAAADLRHHGGGIAPLGAARPYVLTIHDLQYRTFPGHFSRTKRTYLATMIGRSVRRARVVTVPSEYVRSSVIEACGPEPDRRHGRSPRVRTGAADRHHARSRSARSVCARRPTGDRVPSGHSSAQEPPVPHRPAGHDSGATPTSCSC